MSTRAVVPADIRSGMEIPPLTKTAYQRALDELSFSSDSIHNDEYTRGQGYAGALMSAYVLCGYMSELMVKCSRASYLSTRDERLIHQSCEIASRRRV